MRHDASLVPALLTQSLLIRKIWVSIKGIYHTCYIVVPNSRPQPMDLRRDRRITSKLQANGVYHLIHCFPFAYNFHSRCCKHGTCQKAAAGRKGSKEEGPARATGKHTCNQYWRAATSGQRPSRKSQTICSMTSINNMKFKPRESQDKPNQLPKAPVRRDQVVP